MRMAPTDSWWHGRAKIYCVPELGRVANVHFPHAWYHKFLFESLAEMTAKVINFNMVEKLTEKLEVRLQNAGIQLIH